MDPWIQSVGFDSNGLHFSPVLDPTHSNKSNGEEQQVKFMYIQDPKGNGDP